MNSRPAIDPEMDNAFPKFEVPTTALLLIIAFLVLTMANGISRRITRDKELAAKWAGPVPQDALEARLKGLTDREEDFLEGLLEVLEFRWAKLIGAPEPGS